MRTLSEILIDADKTDKLDRLCELCDELMQNKYSYSILELKYAEEHFSMLAKRLASKHAKKILDIINNI